MNDELARLREDFHRFDELMQRVKMVTAPVYDATWRTLGWHESAGFGLELLNECMNAAYWQSLDKMQDAMNDARFHQTIQGAGEVTARIERKRRERLAPMS